MDYIVTAAVGLMVGTAAGLIPGFGALAAVLLMFSWLKDLDAVNIMLFYAAMVSALQYSGSVVAIYLGVPGEQTSLIASRFGHRIHQRSAVMGSNLIGATAVASLWGAMVAVGLLAFSFQWISSISGFFSVRTQLFLITCIALFLLTYNRRGQSPWINAVCIIGGLCLGSIGFNKTDPSMSVTFGQDWLVSGLDASVVILVLFIMPSLLMQGVRAGRSDLAGHNVTWSGALGMLGKHWPSMLRGGAIGSVMGLVPGIGTSACSQVAAGVDEKFCSRLTGQTVAAETANNSAAITSLIPVMLFLLPIVPSEALIVDLIASKNPPMGTTWLTTMITAHWTVLELFLITVIVANICMALLCWAGAPALKSLYNKLPTRVLPWLLIALISALILFNSAQHLRLWLDLGTAFMLLPFAWFMMRRRIDSLPLIFSFMLTDLVLSVWAVSIDLYL